MNRRNICVVTTSRADFGHLLGLLRAIQADQALNLQVISSGTHAARHLGETWREIKASGVKIHRKIAIQVTGTSDLDNIRSLATGLNGFGNALAQLKPQIVVLLGDRFELLAPAIAALIQRIPIAHIHGGELTEGAIDDSVRHAITKMASLHFAATELYRQRIIQMGEPPSRVFNFGAPGLDQLHGLEFLSRAQLEWELGWSLQGPVGLVTYHPVTRDSAGVDRQVESLIEAIKASNVRCIFTMANVDAEGARINRLLQAVCAEAPDRYKWVPHLGHMRYLSCLKHLTLMIGNSSSGIIEAPSFGLPVVNIGDRQRGRLRAANVLDVSCSRSAILSAITKAMSSQFKSSLRGIRNPYCRSRDGKASERIKNVLKRISLSEEMLKKTFHDCV